MLSEQRIKEIEEEHTDEVWEGYWEKVLDPIAFARAIEAECLRMPASEFPLKPLWATFDCECGSKMESPNITFASWDFLMVCGIKCKKCGKSYTVRVEPERSHPVKNANPTVPNPAPEVGP